MSDNLSPSEKLRAAIKTIAAESNITESQFARRMRGTLSKATVNRLLNTDQTLSPYHQHVLIDAAARVGRVSVSGLGSAIRQPSNSVLSPEVELTVGTCISAGTTGFIDITSEIEAAEASCQQSIIFSPHLPFFLLEDEVTHVAVDLLSQRYARDPKVAKRNILKMIADQRESLLKPPSRNKMGIIVVTLMSGLVDLAAMEAPFAGCDRRHIAESAGSVLHDAILDRDLTLAVLDNLNDPKARQWAAPYENVREITIFDSKLMIRRQAGTLAYRRVRAADGWVDRRVIEHLRADIFRGMGLACHELSADETAAFLVNFMTKSGYRGFRRFW